MNLKALVVASLLGLLASAGCSSASPTATQTGAAEKASLTVDNLDAAGCEAYAAKQTRLNSGGAAWTFRMDGTTCVVTQG